MSNSTTSMPNSSAAHQALSSIPGMSAPALNRSKSATATSSLSSNLLQSSSHVKLGRRGSVGSTQVLQEAREEEVIPPARSASNSRQQANGNPATGYLEAKVVILGSQGELTSNESDSSADPRVKGLAKQVVRKSSDLADLRSLIPV